MDAVSIIVTLRKYSSKVYHAYVTSPSYPEVVIESLDGWTALKSKMWDIGIYLGEKKEKSWEKSWERQGVFEEAVYKTIVANSSKFESYVKSTASKKTAAQVNKGLTVRQLLKLCQQEITKGNGDKEVLISTDDECNAFHTLWEGFVSEKKDVADFAKYSYFHDNNNPDDVVLLI